ncbi:MAG: glutamate synthase subunit alpha, partial [Rhodospirillaceae bacterium]|nr:glutamate synthase subunit alpha [Rhodospirillaceae bacterium]
KLWPLIGDGASDSATFDNALELLVAGGYTLAHAMMMMIPEAWDNNPLMDAKRRAFYEYHAALMEPWDGPAAVCFTDGKQIGATLDRNGLRPARYVVTDDDHVIMGSEVGVLGIPESKIIKKWRLQPGKMFLIDLDEGRIIDDAEVKETLSSAKPYQKWLDASQIHVTDLPDDVAPMLPEHETILDMQQAFGYSQEDTKHYLLPMATTGQDPIGSMGRDTPIAVLSDKPKMLYDYFKQNFAQVTNPPIDPIREELVMSLVSLIGPRPNLLDPDHAGGQKRLEVRHPVLTNLELEKIRHIENHVDSAFLASTLDITYRVENGSAGMEAALEKLFAKAEEVVGQGHNIIILSDRGVDAEHVAIPALLATAGVHHHLIRAGLRTDVGLVVETGEARRVHDFCLLAGYGAEAFNPYLALETVADMADELGDVSVEDAQERYIKAVSKGMLKVFSKMGISTFQSYCGAQIFDAVGLNDDFIARFFTKTASQVGGIGLDQVASETVKRHSAAYGNDPLLQKHLDVGGDLAWRHRGEAHAWTPETIASL